jgi:hypothetical protein
MRVLNQVKALLECPVYGHQLIITTTLHSVVRGNVGATLVVARKTSSGGDPATKRDFASLNKPLPYISFCVVSGPQS